MSMYPKPRQEVICWRCKVMIQEGHGPAFHGLCVPCGDAVARERRREEQQMQLRKLRKPAQTAEDMEKAGDPFKGFREEDK
jgi:hypothetical protein